MSGDNVLDIVRHSKFDFHAIKINTIDNSLRFKL